MMLTSSILSASTKPNIVLHNMRFQQRHTQQLRYFYSNNLLPSTKNTIHSNLLRKLPQNNKKDILRIAVAGNRSSSSSTSTNTSSASVVKSSSSNHNNTTGISSAARHNNNNNNNNNIIRENNNNTSKSNRTNNTNTYTSNTINRRRFKNNAPSSSSTYYSNNSNSNTSSSSSYPVSGYHRRSTGLLSKLHTLEDRVFPYLHANTETNESSPLEEIILPSKTNTVQLQSYTESLIPSLIKIKKQDEYNKVVKGLQDIIIGYTKIRPSLSTSSVRQERDVSHMSSGSRKWKQRQVPIAAESGVVAVHSDLLDYSIRAELWLDVLLRLRYIPPKELAPISSTSATTSSSSYFDSFKQQLFSLGTTMFDTTSSSPNLQTKPIVPTIQKPDYERLISSIIYLHYSNILKSRNYSNARPSLKDIDILSTTIDRLYAKLCSTTSSATTKSPALPFLSVIHQILAIYAECKSPTLAMKAKQHYLILDDLHANHPETLKLILKAHANAMSSGISYTSNTVKTSKQLLENMEHIFDHHILPKTKQPVPYYIDVDIYNTLLQGYLYRMMDESATTNNEHVKRTILRKTRKLKFKHATHQSHLHFISIYSQASTDEYLKIVMRLLQHVEYNTMSCNEVLRMIQRFSTGSHLNKYHPHTASTVDNYMNMMTTILDRVPRPNYETFIIPLLISVNTNSHTSHSSMHSKKNEKYKLSEQLVSKMECAYYCGILPYHPDLYVYRLLLQHYATASTKHVNAVYRSKTLLDKLESLNEIQPHESNSNHSTQPPKAKYFTPALSLYTLFFDACIQASFSYHAHKIDFLPLAEEVYDHILTNHRYLFTLPTTPHTWNEKPSFFAIFLVVIAKSSAGRQKRKLLCTRVMKDVICIFGDDATDQNTATKEEFRDFDYGMLMKKLKYASFDVYREFVLEDEKEKENIGEMVGKRKEYDIPCSSTNNEVLSDATVIM